MVPDTGSMAHDAPAAVPRRGQVSRKGRSLAAVLQTYSLPKQPEDPVRNGIGAAFPSWGCVLTRGQS
eukprot:9495567-Pyramimonas_sp.AAC.1